MQIEKWKGIKTTEMKFNMMVRSVKTHYRLMGFDLYEGGSQVSALNAPCNFQVAHFMHFVRVLMSFLWSVFVFGRRSHALGGICAFM